MCFSHMDINEFQQLVRGVNSLDFEVAFFQHEVFAFELNRQVRRRVLLGSSFISAEEFVGTTGTVWVFQKTSLDSTTAEDILVCWKIGW
jgi:hypothetical protein